MYWWICCGKRGVLRVGQLALGTPWLMKEQEQAAFFLPNYKLITALSLKWHLCARITENMGEFENWAHSLYGTDVLVEWKKAPWKALMPCISREHKAESGSWSFSLSSTPPPDRKAEMLTHFHSLTSFCLKQIVLRQLIRSTAKKNSRRLASSTFLDISSVHCLICTS